MDWTLQLEAGGFFCSLRLRFDWSICSCATSLPWRVHFGSWADHLHHHHHHRAFFSSHYWLSACIHLSAEWMSRPSRMQKEIDGCRRMTRWSFIIPKLRSAKRQQIKWCNIFIMLCTLYIGSCYLFWYYSVSTDGDKKVCVMHEKERGIRFSVWGGIKCTCRPMMCVDVWQHRIMWRSLHSRWTRDQSATIWHPLVMK